ncbi:MAG: hypothetical protein ACI9WS_003442, partial [Paraglaciecola psychrophila]
MPANTLTGASSYVSSGVNCAAMRWLQT